MCRWPLKSVLSCCWPLQSSPASPIRHGSPPPTSPGGQTKPDEEESKESVEQLKKCPHRYNDIAAQADEPYTGNLEGNKFSGIYLNQRKKKYWVDEKSGCNCFMLFARDLSIISSEDPQCWKWSALKETSDFGVEVAGLLRISWLEIHGRFNISYLTPGATYRMYFMVMVDQNSYGWNAPVVLRLKDPQGNEQQHLESLMNKPRGEWIELEAGELRTTAASAGEVDMSLSETKDRGWKSGLQVKGICICPTTK